MLTSKKPSIFLSLKIAALGIFAAVGFAILSPKSASALVPWDIPPSIRHQIALYEGGCAGNPNKYFLASWISPAGNPAHDGPITVPYGTTRVALQYNNVIFVCHDRTNYARGAYGGLGHLGLPDDFQTPGAALSADTRYRSAHGVSPNDGGYISPNLVGPGYMYAITKSASTRYWFGNPGFQTFDYITAPMINSKTVNISFTQHEWIEYHGNRNDTWCATSGASYRVNWGLPPPYGCSGHSVGFTIQINVLQHSPIGWQDPPSCTNGLSGWAYDRDDLRRSIPVHVYADGPGGSLVWVMDVPATDILRQDVNNGYDPNDRTSKHGFRITPDLIPAAFKTRARNFYVFAIGIGPDGKFNGDNPLLLGNPRRFDFSACGPSGGSFTLTPVAQTPTGDSESPSTITFTGYINGATTTPVQATATRSIVYKRGALTASLGTQPGAYLYSFPNGQSILPPHATNAAPPGGWQAGDQYCIQLTIAPAAGTVNGSGNVTSITRASERSEACATVSNKPYVSFYGNDVRAGAAFKNGTNCPTNPLTKDIKAFNKGTASSPAYLGSGSQYGVFASGTVEQFASAILRTNPSPPKGLTFANNTAAIYGGGFGLGSMGCISDYFTPTPVASLPDVQVYTGDYTINTTPMTIAKGAKKTIYVTGNATIKSDIVYSTDFRVSKADIPSFYLIVKGDIFIDNAVKQLDGVYIAQPGGPAGSNGTIHTCHPGGTPHAIANLATNCNNQLTINGAFIANKVKLLRTANSLRNAVANEVPWNVANLSRAAEVFNFSPEVYMAKPNLPATNSSMGKYDYIASLPPVL